MASMKNAWCMADLCQYILDWYRDTCLSNTGDFQLSRHDDVVSSSVTPGIPFGFPVIKARYVPSGGGFPTSERIFPFYRPDRGVFTLTEADLLRERPWWQSVSRNFEADHTVTRWQTQVIPALAAIIESLFACTVTTSIAIREMPTPASVWIAQMFVGDNTDGHCFFAAAWVEEVTNGNYGWLWPIETGTPGGFHDTTRPFLDFDPRTLVQAWRTIEGPRGDGGGSTTNIELTETNLTLKEIRDELARAADARTGVSFNGGKVRVEFNPTELAEGGG